MEEVLLYSLIILVPIVIYIILKNNISDSERLKYSDYEGRINKYSLRIQINPKDMMAYYERGLAHLKLKNKTAALEDLKYAGMLGHPKAFDVIEKNNLGELNKKNFYSSATNLSEPINVAKSNEYQGDLEDFNKAIKSNPQNSIAYFMRAGIKEIYKDHVGSLDDLTSAIKINNKYAEAYFKRGSIKYKLRDIDGAKSDLEYANSLGIKKAQSLLDKINDISNN